MSAIDTRIFEFVTRSSPLGIGFRDEATGARVTDGLSVSAWPSNDPSRAVAARLNGDGVAVFDVLPGVARGDFSTGSLPAPRPFVVKVLDTLGRFLPIEFPAGVPAKGLFKGPGGGLLVPLFSAPSRPAPSATADIRAELFDPVAGRPAAHALVELDTPTADVHPFARGLADASGRVLVAAEWPTLPPAGGAVPAVVFGRTWPLTVTVRYVPTPTGKDIPPVADLAAALAAAPASVWDTFVATSPPPRVPLSTVTLTFGVPLLLASSSGDPAGAGAGRLLVTAP
jgi:hypothetical protein